MNQAYNCFSRNHPPVRTIVGMKLPGEDLLVEMVVSLLDRRP